MKKNENGAIIVEATLILPFFMFAIITVLSICNICLAQSKIGTAINETAKEISQYSYLYGLTGLNNKQAQLYKEGETARVGIDSMVDGVSTLYSSASSINNTVSSSYNDPGKYADAIKDISSDVKSGIGGVNNITDGVEALASDPTAILKMVANEGIEFAKSFIASKMAPAFMKKHLKRSDADNCELFLKYVGVVPKGGSYLNGLNFGDSVIFLNGSEEIKIIVKYEIQVWKLLGIDIKLPFVQCGATKAWFDGEASNVVEQPDTGSGEGGTGETNTGNGGGTGSLENDNVVSGGGDSGEKDETVTAATTTTTVTTTVKPFILKNTKEYAKEATHNDESDIVILGKYNGSFAQQSYIDTAIQFNATYFDLDDYDEILEHTSNSYMWDINEQFLKNQKAKGKTFYLTDDPHYANGAFGNEVHWLEQNGYEFKFDPGVSMWKAVKRNG